MRIKIDGSTPMVFQNNILTNKQYNYETINYEEAIQYLQSNQNINGSILILDAPFFKSLEIFFYNYIDKYSQLKPINVNQAIAFLQYLNNYEEVNE